MGETQSRKQCFYKDQLTFIQNTQDPNFGPIDIYRTQQPPYEYIMDYKKNFVEDNEKLNRYLRLMNQLKNMQHKNLSKIHRCEMIEENQMCIKHSKLHTFCHYYNFTLQAAIQKKKIQDSIFPENELVYIMGCLLQAATYLQQYGISVGQYRTKSIYLSPEGYIKLYLLEIDQENRHSCYFKALSEPTTIDNYVLSPQQLHFINQLQYQIKYDPFKADMFAIGMVILELITLDKTKFYYNQSKNELKIDRISFDITTISKNFSEQFINLLKYCLQPNPSKRCSLAQALQQLNSLRKTMKSLTYCIRLQENEQKNSKQFRRQITMSVKGQHILNGLQKKLTPSPITTLSSSVTGQFRIESKINKTKNF